MIRIVLGVSVSGLGDPVRDWQRRELRSSEYLRDGCGVGGEWAAGDW